MHGVLGLRGDVEWQRVFLADVIGYTEKDHFFEKHMHTEYVHRRGTLGTPLQLLRPISRAGQLPDSRSVMPDLGAPGSGARIAVGNPVMYLVYGYHFDTRSSTGSWHYLYTEDEGTLADRPVT